MLDFTSSLYLGFRHPSAPLRPWAQLTQGAPAAVAPVPGARSTAARLAALQGCEAATLAASTLHLFWDLFTVLGRAGVAVYVDAGAYPIASWGAQAAAVQGAPVRRFPHGDVGALLRRLAAEEKRRPVIVVDGLCACCGTLAPLEAYRAAIRPYEGVLVVDDSQALGVLGRAPTPEAPYGRGGGGSLQYRGIGGPDVLVVSSLAKAFGVPLAVLGGNAACVRRVEVYGPTRAHCSPPSAAHVHAAAHALARNAAHGDVLRRRLAQNVNFFRQALGGVGLVAEGGLFPVQSLPPLAAPVGRRLHAGLNGRGIRTVLRRGAGGKVRITFVLTVGHAPGAMHTAVEVLGELMEGLSSGLTQELSQERTMEGPAADRHPEPSGLRPA